MVVTYILGTAILAVLVAILLKVGSSVNVLRDIKAGLEHNEKEIRSYHKQLTNIMYDITHKPTQCKPNSDPKIISTLEDMSSALKETLSTLQAIPILTPDSSTSPIYDVPSSIPTPTPTPPELNIGKGRIISKSDNEKRIKMERERLRNGKESN